MASGRVSRCSCRGKGHGDSSERQKQNCQMLQESRLGVPLWGMSPKEPTTGSTTMSAVALFAAANKWRQPACVLTDEWLQQRYVSIYLYIHIFLYILVYLIIYEHIHTNNGVFLSLKKGANLSYCLSFATTRMKHGDVMPSEISPSQKDRYGSVHVCGTVSSWTLWKSLGVAREGNGEPSDGQSVSVLQGGSVLGTSHTAVGP